MGAVDGPTQLGAATWPEVDAVSPAPLLAVPLGSLEQHGPHLPLDTDTRIADAVARGLAARRGDVVVAPALPYGASGEHAGFPGTLSLGLDALGSAVVELVRSADAFRGVVLVNGHGGNLAALATASARLRCRGAGHGDVVAAGAGRRRPRRAHRDVAAARARRRGSCASTGPAPATPDPSPT